MRGCGAPPACDDAVPSHPDPPRVHEQALDEAKATETAEEIPQGGPPSKLGNRQLQA